MCSPTSEVDQPLKDRRRGQGRRQRGVAHETTIARADADIVRVGAGPPDSITGKVIWVVDGDTIHVHLGGRRVEKVRYIGVNAPEIPHVSRTWIAGGDEAFQVNRQLVVGQTVRLAFDVRRRDSWGRLLAYVWIESARTPVMANSEMLRRGYAQVMTIPPNVRYQALFVRLQREARAARRGLWRES